MNHHTYRFARRAQSEGLAVIDDPDSILRCANKVYLAESFQREHINAPETLIVHNENRFQVERKLGLPCVLKLPDSSFSLGVKKAETPAELQNHLTSILKTSDLVIAQEYLPTSYDWRIGILAGEPLFACRYYMAPVHWQIYNWDKETYKEQVGESVTLPLSEVPPVIMETACKAASLIGNGLYGVDLKEINGKAYVIEINDNPNIDGGIEDEQAPEEIYARILDVLKSGIVGREDK